MACAFGGGVRDGSAAQRARAAGPAGEVAMANRRAPRQRRAGGAHPEDTAVAGQALHDRHPQRDGQGAANVQEEQPREQKFVHEHSRDCCSGRGRVSNGGAASRAAEERKDLMRLLFCKNARRVAWRVIAHVAY
eukprot:4114172-Prymnesium_polylepis.2